MMARLSVAEYVSPTLFHQEWCALLMLGYLWDTGNTASKKLQVCDKVRHLMAGCLEEFPGEMNVDDLRGFWRGKEFTALTDNEKQEILWELAEMGFRLKVYALDRRATPLDIDDERRRKMVARCFPYGSKHPVCVDIGSANYGLAHPSWLEHAPYLFSLRTLMSRWNGDQPDFLSSSNRNTYTENEYLHLEKQVTAHYADTFFLYFGRAPTLPRQLHHDPDHHYVPEVRERVLTTRQGVYLDVE